MTAAVLLALWAAGATYILGVSVHNACCLRSWLKRAPTTLLLAAAWWIVYPPVGLLLALGLVIAWHRGASWKDLREGKFPEEPEP